MAEGQGPDAGGHSEHNHGAGDRTKHFALALAAVKNGQRQLNDLCIFGDRPVGGEMIESRR